MALEHLESRRVLSVSLPFNATYHGGLVMQNVQVETVYYGSAFTADSIAQLNAFVGYLVNSPFMDGSLNIMWGAGAW